MKDGGVAYLIIIMEFQIQAPKIKLGAKNQNGLEKTLCKKCTQNTLQCFFCTKSPAYFTCIFKDCTSRREEKSQLCGVSVMQGSGSAWLSTALLSNVVLVTEEDVQHTGCAAFKQLTRHCVKH